MAPNVALGQSHDHVAGLAGHLVALCSPLNVIHAPSPQPAHKNKGVGSTVGYRWIRVLKGESMYINREKRWGGLAIGEQADWHLVRHLDSVPGAWYLPLGTRCLVPGTCAR